MTGAEAILDRCVLDDECLIWLGAQNSKGYGSVYAGKGKTLLAHRVVFAEMVGPIEDGMTVDHLCRNKLCMNIWHMELVTRAENSRRKIEAQTHCKRGHLLSGDNVRLYTRASGQTSRVCRACKYEESTASAWRVA